MDRERLSGGCLLALSLTALILCSRLHGVEGQMAVIDVAPQAQTAPLGSNVTFECRGNHDIYFVLNDSFPLDQEANRRDLATPRGIFTEFPENPLVNRLFVVASLENNQSILIHCVSDESALNNARSVSVALTVFGLPLAPTDLTVEGGSLTEVELSWVAPFTQAGENVTYTVEIANQETGFSTSRPSEETELTFADPGSSVCSQFTYMVFTENAAGTSESPSNIVSKAFPAGPGTVDDVAIAVSLAGSPSATLTFQTPILCEDFPPSNYTVTLTTGGSSDQQGPFPASPGGATQVVALTMLEEDALYVATVTTANPFGSTTSTEFELYTTDLQQLVVDSTSTTLDITCTLATGSDALGCNVIARPEGDPTPFWSVNLTRSGSELVLPMSFLLSEVDPPSDSFLIFASDLEVDGSIGELQLPAEIQPTPSSTSVFTPTPVPTPPLTSAPPPLSSTPNSPATPTPDSTESSGLSQQTLIIIIAVAAAGGALFFLIVLVVCIIICINCRRGRKYDVDDHPRTSSHLYSSTPPHKTNSTPAAEPSKLNMVEFDTNVPEMYATVGGGQQQPTAPEEPKPPGPVVYDVIPNGGGREFEQQEAAKKEGIVPNPVYETVGKSARQGSGGGTIKMMAENPMYSQPSELQKPVVPYQMVTFERQKQRDPNQIDLMENVSYGALPSVQNGSSTAPS